MSETNLKTGSTASISSPKRQSNSSEQNEKELFSPKRTSDERPQMPPLGPNGKQLQPPIGPDGRPLYPPLGPDGKPLPPPKLGPDGKPLPPPIIGPDGNELPRPTDKDGRPMPVYITKDGKAVLDEEGKPIALKFDAEGKPVPLYPPTSQDSVNGGDPGPGGNAGNGMAAAQGKLKDNIPGFLLWMGLIDLVLSLFITGLEGYLLSELASDRKAKEDKAFYCLMTAVILSALGVIFAIVLIFSVKQSKSLGVYVWGGATIVFLVAMLIIIGILFSDKDKDVHPYRRGLFALTLVVCRSLLLCLTVIYYCEGPRNEHKNNAYPVQRVVMGGGYPQQAYYPAVPRTSKTDRGGSGGKTVIIQQPMVVPSYGYGGYAGGGYPYYGRPYGGMYAGGYGGMGYEDAALLGFAAGSMMGYGHYGYGYPYGGYGYGGGYPFYDSWGYDSFW